MTQQLVVAMLPAFDLPVIQLLLEEGVDDYLLMSSSSEELTAKMAVFCSRLSCATRDASHLIAQLPYLQKVIDALPHQVSVLDDAGTVVAVNLAWCDFADENGLELPDYGIGTNYLQACRLDLSESTDQTREAAAGIESVLQQSKRVFQMGYDCHSPRQLHWFSMSVNRLVLNEHVFAIVTHQNVTEQVLAEKALAESEELFRSTFESAGIGMAIATLEGRYVNVNEALSQLLGYTEVELLSVLDADITHEADRGECRRYLEQVQLESGARRSIEKRYVHRDGQIVWVILTAVVVGDVAHVPRFLVLQMEDITRRHLMESELQDSETRYRMLVENAFDGIYLIHNRKYRYVNPRFCEITGYSFEELTSPSFDFNVMLSEADQTFIEERWKGRQAGEKLPGQYDMQIISKQGERVHIEVSTVALNDRDDVVVLGIMRDITEQRKAEEQIEASLREKEVLLKEIHHRVKNNLQLVISLLDLQMDSRWDPQLAAMFKDSQSRIRSMALIHEQLYQSNNLARIDFGAYAERLCTQLVHEGWAQFI